MVKRISCTIEKVFDGVMLSDHWPVLYDIELSAKLDRGTCVPLCLLSVPQLQNCALEKREATIPKAVLRWDAVQTPAELKESTEELASVTVKP